MGRYFFTAGMMPSEGLLLSVQSDFFLQNQWRVNGMHYRKTAEQWLRNMDSKRDQVIPVLESIYGRKSAARWFQRWRIFFMACSELWGYNRGEEWFVSHYLFHKA
jgi:cyclopropane-fatty-acyl-phospholipid synthase